MSKTKKLNENFAEKVSEKLTEEFYEEDFDDFDYGDDFEINNDVSCEKSIKYFAV